MHRRFVLTLALAGFAAGAIPSAFAQDRYPTRPIRLVVPFPPGGIMDTVGRQWAERVSASLGSVVIDNRGGAGGTIGAAEVARAKPDGYTILMGNTSTQILNPTAMRHPPYDPTKDFTAVDIIAQSPTSFVVHPSLPIRSLKELIAYARANPGKLSYGSAGAGTMTNLAGEMFKQLGGNLSILHVPYKGIGLATTDLLGGYIPMMTPHINAHFIALHHSGKVRILAVASPKRIKAAPEIPAAVETLPGMIAQLLSGIFAPAGTPPAIVERLSQASRKALADPAFRKWLVDAGSEAVEDGNPAGAQRLLETERKRLAPIIRRMDYKLD
jgi:tripartite-type tricarboxylate transporter receptor subunit TctC